MAEPHLRERFICAPGMKIEAQERLAEVQFGQLRAHLERVEAMMERLERRLWLTVFGVLATILAQGFQSIMEAVP